MADGARRVFDLEMTVVCAERTFKCRSARPDERLLMADNRLAKIFDYFIGDMPVYQKIVRFTYARRQLLSIAISALTELARKQLS